MEPTANPDFQHGYTSGVEGVNRETYEGYLSSQVNTDWLLERIQEKQTELTMVERQLTESTESNRTAFASLQTHALQVERLAKQLGQRESDRQDWNWTGLPCANAGRKPPPITLCWLAYCFW